MDILPAAKEKRKKKGYQTAVSTKG